MRFAYLLGLGAVVLVACKSSGGSPSDGAIDSTGGAGATGTAGKTGGAGTGGGGGGGASATVRDCLPDCIVNLRSDCERPNIDGGTCVAATAADGTETACFSTGVREQLAPVPDGGQEGDYTFFRSNGTVCYRVHLQLGQNGGDTVTYSDPSGNVVGVLSSSSAGSTATCNGVAVPLPPNDPGCGMLDLAECPAGTCP